MIAKSSLACVGALLCLAAAPVRAADLGEPPIVRGGLPDVPPPEVVEPVPVAPVAVVPPPPIVCGFLSPCAPPYVLAPDGFYFVQARPPQPNPMDFVDERNDYNQ